MNTADAADKSFEPKITILLNTVESRRSALDEMEDLVRQYESGKELYPQIYARARLDRDHPLADRKAHEMSVLQLRASRKRLQGWAELLGCESDCAAFLASVEGEVDANVKDA